MGSCIFLMVILCHRRIDCQDMKVAKFSVKHHFHITKKAYFVQRLVCFSSLHTHNPMDKDVLQKKTVGHVA